jgi:predicted ATP-grasp superfamily ATP-dependent carboligase
MEEFPPAVVATMSYSGLALARSLGRKGIKVYGIATNKKEVGMASRYITPVVYPNIIRSYQDTLDAYIDLASRIGRRAVMFPTGDALVLPLSQHREELSKHYSFLMPSPEATERLVSKEGLSDIIRERGIPGPTALTVMTPDELDHAESEIRYPVIVKPVYSASWYRREMTDHIGYRKVILVENREDLKHWYSRIAVIDPRVILQEYVPGEDVRLYYVCGYFNADSKLEAAFAGQKVRVIPVHFGSASFVQSMHDERLIEAARGLLQPLGYKGLFGVEYKLDPRDDTYKVIEVNVRWGLWDGLARRCGIDLAYLAYAREAGLPYEPPSDYRDGVRWLSIRRDLAAFQGYRKEGALTTAQWLRSLMGETEHATFALDDPMPGLVEISAIADEKLHSLLSRFKPHK